MYVHTSGSYVPHPRFKPGIEVICNTWLFDKIGELTIWNHSPVKLQDGAPVLGWDELDDLELGEVARLALSICPFICPNDTRRLSSRRP